MTKIRPAFILLVFLQSVIVISMGEPQPQWEDAGNYRWDNVIQVSQGYNYNSRPLLDTGLAELKIRILTDDEFMFWWSKEGGDNTNLRFYINDEEKSQCNEAILAKSRHSYSVKKRDILRWLFTGKDLGNWTATVLIPIQEHSCNHTINRPKLIKTYIGFPLSHDFFAASGVTCPQGNIPIVNFSLVDIQTPGNYTYLARCDDFCSDEMGEIVVLPLEFYGPSICCIEQPGIEFSISEIQNANYYWSLSEGAITSGQGTSKIVWTSGSGSCNVSVRIELTGIEKVFSRYVQVNPNCTYLNYCDDLNRNISDNKELRLLCNPCGDRTSYQGKVSIKNVHNCSIKSSCKDQSPRLDGFIEIEDSSDIKIEGLDIVNGTVAINVENMTYSNISNNKIKSDAVAFYMSDSNHNIFLENEISSHNNYSSLKIKGGINNTIEDCLNQDRIREIVFNGSTQTQDITCLILDGCYTCNYTGTSTCVDLKNYTKHNWRDLHNRRFYCIS